jgi:hypothetical protein
MVAAQRAIEEDDTEEYKDKLKAAAFTAFLSGAAGKETKFEGFLKSLGLIEEVKYTTEQMQDMAKVAKYKAEKIKAADRARNI